MLCVSYAQNIRVPNLHLVEKWKNNAFFDSKYARDGMEALAISEFYGFARLGFCPSDVTFTEEELQRMYNSTNKRVPEFVAGSTMVEVKRLKVDFDINSIVKKACEKAHKNIVCDKRITSFYICYAVPDSTTMEHIGIMKKMVRLYTFQYASLMCVKSIFVMFVRTPDCCFKF